MIKLFKFKSLKSNTKQGADGASAQGADNKNAKKQRGRSMVEMLGVLAIIGVLSIGGIQGYTLAMRKYKANEILNVMSKYALILYTSCQQAMERDPDHYYITNTTNNFNGVRSVKWGCPKFISFSDSGLGALPAGVIAVYEPIIATVIDNSKSTNGTVLPEDTDIVMLQIWFDTKELCQTVSAMAGSYSYSADTACNRLLHSSVEDGLYHANYTAFIEN